LSPPTVGLSPLGEVVVALGLIAGLWLLFTLGKAGVL
jgi:hypothetical protein